MFCVLLWRSICGRVIDGGHSGEYSPPFSPPRNHLILLSPIGLHFCDITAQKGSTANGISCEPATTFLPEGNTWVKYENSFGLKYFSMLC